MIKMSVMYSCVLFVTVDLKSDNETTLIQIMSQEFLLKVKHLDF